MTIRQAALLLLLLAAVNTLAQEALVTKTSAPKATAIDVLAVVPRDMQHLFERSAVVARVRVVSSAPIIVDRPGNLPPTVRTKYTATLIDQYKGSAESQTLEFYQTAGAVNNEQYNIRVERQTTLAPGREYVVFLMPYAFFHSYSLTGEDNGAFEIRDSRVKALGAAEVSRAHDNMPFDRFVSELRRLARRAAK